MRADQFRNNFGIVACPRLPHRQHLFRGAGQNVRNKVQDVGDTQIDRGPNSTVHRRKMHRHDRWRCCPPCMAAAAPRDVILVRIDTAPTPSRTAAGSYASRTETSCRWSADPRDACAAQPRPARAPFAVAIGSAGSPLSSPMIAACSALVTVMALPLMPRLKGATIGTRTCARPRLEAMATGAKRCAASNSPILSLSRTFDHDTSPHQRHIEIFGRR